MCKIAHLDSKITQMLTSTLNAIQLRACNITKMALYPPTTTKINYLPPIDSKAKPLVAPLLRKEKRASSCSAIEE